MIEKDMEDLLAAFPEEFFPRKHFALVGRQQSFSGVGRFDLLFEDEFKNTILMELKARTLKYEDATQVARYRDELKRNGCANIFMWLVAPQVPASVREFLDDKGIEHSEIHVAEFRRVAERHGLAIQSESAMTTQNALPVIEHPRRGNGARSGSQSVPNSTVRTGSVVTAPSSLHWAALDHDLRLQNPERLDSKKFLGLVETFASVVPSGKNKKLVHELTTWAENPRVNRLSAATVDSLLRWTITGTTWSAAVPYAHDVWECLFGTPVPTWKQWDQNERRYKFDQEAWQKWFDSLNGK